MNRQLGQMGEVLAAEFLTALGYKIIARNHRSRFGEIDIVALHKGDIIFVEVKARSSDRFGTPAEAITRSKLEKLRRLIADFIVRYNIIRPVRFEVVVVGDSGLPQLITEIDFVDR